MALPLPKVVADVEAGGPLVTSLKGMNALQKDMLENQWYGPKTAAQIASQLTYSNLMGPQFLAKLMGNDAFVANLGDEKANQTVPFLYKAGTGQGTGANYLNQFPYMPSNQGGLGSWLQSKVNDVKNVFGFGQQPPVANPSPPQNAFQQPVQTQTGPSPSASVLSQGAPDPSLVQQAVAAWQNSLEAKAQGEKEGFVSIPNTDDLMNWYKQQPNAQPTVTPSSSSGTDAGLTYGERAAKYKKIIKQGEKTGEIIANDIGELGKTYGNAVKQEKVFDDLITLSNDPIIQKMKNSDPQVFQGTQMKVLKTIGTPEEKEAIGRFYNTTNEAMKNAINSFEGNKMRGEVDITKEMKVNPNDTYGVMIGKIQSAATYNQYDKQLSALTAKKMDEQHITKQQALEQADKELNGKKLRQDIINRLHPVPTETDIKHMMKIYNLTRDQVVEKLRAKGHKV